MASNTMTSFTIAPSSFPAGNRAVTPAVMRRSVFVASAVRTEQVKGESAGNGKRRELMFAAAAAACARWCRFDFFGSISGDDHGKSLANGKEEKMTDKVV